MAGLMGTGGSPSIVQIVGTLLSGTFGSGQVGPFALMSGTVNSGQIASGAVLGSLGGGAFVIASGTVGANDLGSGVVGSGKIASGAILGSLGGGAFVVASGTIGTNDIGSGTFIDFGNYVLPIAAGNQNVAPAIITGEIISGVKAVMLSQSGSLLVAMAAVSGRMPAVGVVVDNIASGIQANVYTQGILAPTSGLVRTAGFYGSPMWVGRSGNVTVMSGFFGSGGWASGDFGQRIGIAVPAGSGGILLNVDPTVYSGGPLGIAAGPAGVF